MFGQKFLFPWKFFSPDFFFTTNFWPELFFARTFFTRHFCSPEICCQNFLWPEKTEIVFAKKKLFSKKNSPEISPPENGCARFFLPEIVLLGKELVCQQFISPTFFIRNCCSSPNFFSQTFYCQKQFLQQNSFCQ